MATGNSKFPGLNEKYVMEIEQRTANVPAGAKEILQQKMYSDFYAQQKREEEQAERLAMKNQIAQKQLDPNADNKGSMLQLKKGNLADVIRNYYKLNIADGDDDAIVEKFTNGIKDGDKMYIDYLNGDNNDIMVKTGLFGDKWKQLNAQQYVTPEANVSNTVTQAQTQQKPTNLTSTSHFDDAEYAKYYLDNTDKEYQAFVKAAREAGYEDRKIASLVDAKKTYDEFLERGFGDKAEEVNVGTFQGFVNFFGNAYNNLAGNNPYVGIAPKLNMQSIQFKDDLLGAGNNYGDLRASSGWTKGGEIFGDLLANTAVMMLLPGIGGEAKMESVAESALNNGTKGVVRNLTQRGIYGAAEGAEFGALATMGQENADLNKLSTNMIAGGGLGSVFGVAGGGLNAYKYRNILKSAMEEGDKAGTVKNLLTMYDKGVRPTSRGMKTNTQLQQYDDDALGAVETIVKNKEGLRYIDVNGEETFGHLPRNLDEFSQAIKQSKQSIYNRYSSIAREAGKTTEVDTSDIVKELKTKLADKEWRVGQSEATISRIEKWIKDLESLNNKMSVEGTQTKIQELNEKLQAFLKNQNPNDVGTNAVDGMVLNGFKKGVDDAIENAGLDSEEYFALRNAYKQLKTIESDVNHRAIVYGRQNPESLVDSLSNLSSIDAIAKFLKNPKEGALKFAGSQLEKLSAKSRNNPNKMIDKMFREADDTISKSETLKTQSQIAGERTQKQAYNIRKNRAQRLQERQEAYNSKEQARQALLEKQQQQEAAYQEYLSSKSSENTPIVNEVETSQIEKQKQINELKEKIKQREKEKQEAGGDLDKRDWDDNEYLEQAKKQLADLQGESDLYKENGIKELRKKIAQREKEKSEANGDLDKWDWDDNEYLEKAKEELRNLENEYKKSGNIENQDYNYSSLDSNQIINDGQRTTNNGDSINGLDRGGDQGMVGEAPMTDFGTSQGGAGASGKPITVTDGNEMVNISKNLQSKNERGLFMDVHTPEEYSSFQNFTNPNQSATISVKPDHTITNFVSTEKGAGKELMFKAVEAGGDRMDQYGLGLTKYYENFGFEPVARVKFNREYAPEGWNFARDGEPDIFVMKHNGESPAAVREKYGTYKHKTPKELEDLPELDYDSALEYRDSVINIQNDAKLTPAQKVEKIKQKEILAKSKSNKDQIFKEYEEKFGSYVNPDEFRPRINNGGELEANLTHEGASWLSDEYFNYLLNKSGKGSKGVVVAGGPGSGKGYSAKVLGIEPKDHNIFVDKTKGNKELVKMLDKGMDVDYYVVIPNADNIVDQITGRALSKGRTLPINSRGLPTHKEVVEVVEKVLQMQKDGANFRFHFVTNPGKGGVTRELGMEEGYKLFREYASKLEGWTPDRVEQVVQSYKAQGLSDGKIKELLASLGGLLAIGSLVGSGEEV